MIRVLQVMGSLNSGGSQSMIMNIYREIDRSQVQFDFIIDRENEIFYKDEIISLGGRVFVLPNLRVKKVPLYIKEWDSFFKKHPEYKIIHGHVRSTAALYLSIAKKNGLRTISHSHSTSSGEGYVAIIKNILQYPIRYIADYLFACSLDAGEWLFGKKACLRDNFTIIKNSIDVSKYKYDQIIRGEVRRELNIEGKFVIGHVGRFHPAKNHEFLVNIFKDIRSRNCNAVLLLVGEGELRGKIEQLVNSLDIKESVIFTGNVSNIHFILQAMDVFVMPSLYEGLGVALIEAQASGLPSVVADSIPEEAFLTENVKKVSLNDSLEIWIDEILNNEGKNREDFSKQIIESGYDVVENALRLQKFYIRLVR